MTNISRGRKIELEHLGNRGSDQVHAWEGLGKIPKTYDQHLKGRQVRIQCSMCGKLHNGVCRSRGLGCYNYSQVGYISSDCLHEASPLCFHYNQVGHKKADCPRRRGGAVNAPAPAISQISDGRESGARVPEDRSHALQ